VQTEKVFRDDITETVTGNGKIYPETEVKISARVAGKITSITVEEGDTVRSGQVLVTLEQEQYKATLTKAEYALTEAEANLTLAKNELKRTKELYEKNLTSAATLETAQAKYDQALSLMQQRKASVKEAQDALAWTVLSTPIHGVVIQKNKEVGEVALGSQFQEDVILVIADLKGMEARVEVNENDIIDVNLGDSAEVEIDAFPDTTFKGIVSEISNSAKTEGLGTVEEVTNFEVKIRLLNKLPSFRPGMSATADIATETHHDVLNVPIQSVTVRERKTLEKKRGMEEKNRKEKEEESIASKKKKRKKKKDEDLMEVVFVVNDGIAEMHPVKIGISDDNYYEAISGLEEGEEVITGPFRVLSRTLKDGQKVKVNNKKKRKSRNE
ncbi:MAG: efflux RND transporter periplasmic adaptor subunit, partial [Calditrichia bacterium]